MQWVERILSRAGFERRNIASSPSWAALQPVGLGAAVNERMAENLTTVAACVSAHASALFTIGFCLLWLRQLRLAGAAVLAVALAASALGLSSVSAAAPEDIVPWVRMMVSDGWWMTGQTILVNGGYTTK